MQYVAFEMTNGEYISHHGVKGQKWGRRRYQNPDGTLINPKASKTTQRVMNDHNNMTNKQFKQKYYVSKKTYAKRVNKMGGDPYKYRTNKNFRKSVKSMRGSKSHTQGKVVAKRFLTTGLIGVGVGAYKDKKKQRR